MSYFWHPIKKILIGYDEGTGCVVELTPVEVSRYDSVAKLPQQTEKKTRHKKSDKEIPVAQKGKTTTAVVELHSQGKTNAEIAKSIGVGENTVSYHLSKMRLTANKKGTEFVPNRNGRIPFSQSTYNTVKALLNNGTPAYAIVSEKGLDPGEVKRIEESKSYDNYFKT